MLTRRDVMLAFGAGLAAGPIDAPARSTPPRPRPDAGAPAPRPADVVARFAFLTDAHLRAPDDPDHADEHRSAERLPRAFAAARAAEVDLIVFGGDNVMAVDHGNSEASARAQFAHWSRLVAEHTGGLPTLSVIGNHDIWRGEHADAHPQGGKPWALEAFGMPHRFFHHDVGGWRFCLLDTYHDDGCHLDDEQMGWLRQRITEHDGPVCLVHHAPVVTVGQFLEQRDPGIHGGYNAPRGWVIGNAADVVRLVHAHPNVRLSLCGHMHQHEDIAYVGCRWVDGGAVSGAWWNGDYLGVCPPSLLIVDLRADGTSDLRTILYESEPTNPLAP